VPGVSCPHCIGKSQQAAAPAGQEPAAL